MLFQEILTHRDAMSKDGRILLEATKKQYVILRFHTIWKRTD